ncbi:[NiFe]-hydrogenase assembly chaperone HybE [Mangrovimicrobium sediminis]|uniref:[NiFe]-hydrogenase assembly chaperone HybE n=1 Tax=Mangrovimicrobium sediminis TaxID=2562682 RepID=A0A4Z0M4K3_9GAMM|nr:[NiFe]-hydrogenase assembly chaperone HybE [Haliea sp. SAOS-164]
MAQWQETLESTFTSIQLTRMRGVPVIHPELSVSAEHFTRWQDYYLGVLVTPWFMNLVLLPASDATREAFAARKVGSKQSHVFPAGGYEFIVGEEPALGHYQACSLFSPMFEFRDQAAALDTAAAVLAELMNDANCEQLDAGGNPLAVEPAAPAAAPTPEVDQTPPATTATAATEPPAQPAGLSRRQLFTGGRR